MYLNCKTYYSFRYGCFSTEELVETAAVMGIPSLALTNINNTCDAWHFVLQCEKKGIKPVLGAEIRNGEDLNFVLIAANNRGFAWINRFISEHLLAEKAFPTAPTGTHFFDELHDGFVIYPFSKNRSINFPNERIGILSTELNKLFNRTDKKLRENLVVLQPVTFQNKKFYNVHRLLRAVAHNTLLSKLPSSAICGVNEYFASPSELLESFKQYPGIITNTYKLLDLCEIRMDFGKDKNKKTFSATMEDDRILLSKLANDGLINRYGTKNRSVRARVDKELSIIDKLGFNAYFLITWDIIRYAKSKGYYHVGRGSGANSIVAYCLQITDVDPVDLDLYFERFLNPHRSTPPDFDIDFSWTDRDDVIDYVFKRYGRDFVSLLGMYATFQYNAIIRELGKVFGLPKMEIDELAEKGHYNGDTRGENFGKKPAEDHLKKLVLQYGKYLQHFPEKLSIHPGGMLISELPIYNYTAVHMPPKGFPTSQIDMFVADDIGLYKLDILSQRGLGHIKECLSIVKKNKGIDIDIHQIEKFKKDERIRNNIRNANTIGCFYIESPAMRHVLKKLRCDDYLTLVAASSIIRPGVGRSGMMNEYIRRFHHPDKFEYLHPKLGELLKETYGVMVYQEDVIKVAHFWAGLDMADADLLRRATSFKYRSKDKMHMLKEKFFTNCKNFGYSETSVQEVWRQIESFAEFSFCKAHSASFAVESYQSLYLKSYFPKEFMVAVINNFGGFYSHGNRELYFYELMKAGGIVHPPCVNESDHLTNIKGDDVYVGFIHIKSLEQSIAEKLIEERSLRGKYTSLDDFVERTKVTPEQLNILVRAGALSFTGIHKKKLLWESDMLMKKNKTLVPAHESLFKEPAKSFRLPDLPSYELDEVYDQVELLGFPVTDPFVLVDDDPEKYLPAHELKDHVGKTVTVLGYHITQKPIRTIHGQVMSFGTFIDRNKDWIDTVHFPPVFKMAPPQSGFYRITGRVTEEFDVISIEVSHIGKVGIRSRKGESSFVIKT